MSLKIWAIKISDLKTLDWGALVGFMLRCVVRGEPWVPREAVKLWNQGVDLLAAGALGKPGNPGLLTKTARSLGDLGALACQKFDGTPDEVLGRCMNYACQTLVEALEALAAGTPEGLKKAGIQTAKLSASIMACLAHEGRIRLPGAEPTVDGICTAVWDEIRRDAAVLGAPDLSLPAEGPGLRRYLESFPLWSRGEPEWR